MKEVMPGSSIYWYPTQEQYVTSKSSNATQLSSNIISVFFSKDVLAVSNVKGGGSKYTPLNETITQTMTSIKVISVYYTFLIYRLCFTKVPKY